MASVALGVQPDRHCSAFDYTGHGFIRKAPRLDALAFIERPEQRAMGDVTRVVLEVRPRAGEGDALVGAVLQQGAVDELGAVVTIQAQDAKRQLGT